MSSRNAEPTRHLARSERRAQNPTVGEPRDRPLLVTPIGVVRTPFRERLGTPRQPAAAKGVAGRIELEPGRGFEDATRDLPAWSHIWVLFWFDRAEGWRPCVLPPRSDSKRGLFATRAPHRPNPIGMSALRFVRQEGLVLHVLDVDMLDRTPVLDIKPYVPYTDAISGANHGWLEPCSIGAEQPHDPQRAYALRVEEPAASQLRFLRDGWDIDLEAALGSVLALGPRPHAYRRIRQDGNGFRIAFRDWRARFHLDGTSIVIDAVMTGYRPRELWAGTDPALNVHRAFVHAFGEGLAVNGELDG